MWARCFRHERRAHTFTADRALDQPLPARVSQETSSGAGMIKEQKFGDDASVSCTVVNGQIQQGTGECMPQNPPCATVNLFDQGGTILLSPFDAQRLAALGIVIVD